MSTSAHIGSVFLAAEMVDPQLARYICASGSNISSVRLIARGPSARVLGRGALAGHRLAWHKVSVDGSGKCDVVACDADDAVVHGVVYAIDPSEKTKLDRVEGLGKGYEERDIVVAVDGASVEATMYFATRIDSTLLPYSWYKANVLAGAREHGLPESYLRALEAVDAREDADVSRHDKQMALIPLK